MSGREPGRAGPHAAEETDAPPAPRPAVPHPCGGGDGRSRVRAGRDLAQGGAAASFPPLCSRLRSPRRGRGRGRAEPQELGGNWRSGRGGRGAWLSRWRAGQCSANVDGFSGRCGDMHAPFKGGASPPCPAVGLTATPLSSASCANQEDSPRGASSLLPACRRLGTALHLGRARWPGPSGPRPPQDLQRGAVPLDRQR